MVRGAALADACSMNTEVKKLTRSSTDRVIAGVAGGIGRYFSIDPVIVRLALIVLTLLGGVGVVAYLVAWLIVPTDDPDAPRSDAGYVLRRLGMAFGVLALTGVVVVAGFFGAATGGAATVAIIVIAAGGVLVLGSVTQGLRWLIVPAIALALSAGIAAAADLDLRGGAGKRFYEPATAAGLRPDYKLGVGHLRLDLRNTRLPAGEYRVHLKVGMGSAEVLVPANVCVSTTAHVTAGDIQVFDIDNGGTYQESQDLNQPRQGKAHLIVDADMGLGLVRVEPKPTGTARQQGACING